MGSSEITEISDIPQGVINISASNDFVGLLTNDLKLYAHGKFNDIFPGRNDDIKLFHFNEIKEKILVMSCSYNSIFFVTESGRAGVQ